MNSLSHSQVKSNSTGSIVTIFFAFIVVHGLLLGFGLANEDSLLSGDRANSRNATISYVFDIDKIGGDNVSRETRSTMDPMLHIGDRILKSGHPGDYLISGVILKLTNDKILVLFQLLLALVSTFCVYALLLYFGFSVRAATLTTLFYLLLPGSLLPPHQLSTESLFIPCAIIGCYLLIISDKNPGLGIAFLSGLLLFSVAIFVRPQLIFFPLLLVVVYLLFSAKKLNTIFFTIIPVSLLFSAIWVVVVVSNDVRFTLGGEDRSFGKTLFETAEQMAMSGDFEFASDAYLTRSMPLSDFSKLVIDNPISYLRQRSISTVSFVVNPGTYALVARHLKYIDKNHNTFYWQHLRARAGIFKSLVEIVKRGPMFSFLIISTALIWCLVVFSAVVGLLSFIKDKEVGWFPKSLLLSLAAYQVAVVTLLSVGARWQQRSLVDFIIIILALYGLKKVQEHFSYKRQASQIESIGIEGR